MLVGGFFMYQTRAPSPLPLSPLPAAYSSLALTFKPDRNSFASAT